VKTQRLKGKIEKTAKWMRVVIGVLPHLLSLIPQTVSQRFTEENEGNELRIRQRSQLAAE